MSTLSFEHLTLVNFKSFAGTHEFELNRAPGLYYITGQNHLFPELGANGVGKSTIWDALFWILFNKTIRDARPANAIVPWDGSAKRTEVSLVYSRLGKRQTLTRARSPNSLTLTYRDKVREIGQEEVPTLLGMSEETFRRTVVLGQFGSLFLDLRPEEQARMFGEALDLDVWLRASDRAGALRKEALASADKGREEIARLEGRLEEVRTSIAAEKASGEGYEARRDAWVGELAAKALELTKESKGITKNPLLASARSPVAASSPAGVASTLRALLLATRARQRLLLDALGELRAISGRIGVGKAGNRERIETYRLALKGSRKCPECGQTVEASHLKTKLAEEEDELTTAEHEFKVTTTNIQRRAASVSEVEDEIKKLEAFLVRADKISGEWDTIERELKRLKAEGNPHEAQMEHLRHRRSTAKENLASAKEKLTDAEAKVQVWIFWAAAYREIRLSIIDGALRELEMSVARHASALGLPDWRVEFRTERETTSGSVVLAFTTLLYPPDREEPIKFESYSGGESQRLQLATAFGLSEVLLERAGVSPSIEVLDEPTKGLSPEGIDDLLEQLRARALELGRAIYFVDHHSLDRGAFDDVITVVKDKDGARII